MRNVIKVTPIFGIVRKTWGAACILIKFNDGVYICICNIKSDEYKSTESDEYKSWTKHAFGYDGNFKPLNQSKCCGDIIDNRADAPICVLGINT